MKINDKLIKLLALTDLNLEELFILYSITNKYTYHKQIKTWPASSYKLVNLEFITPNNKVTESGKALIMDFELLENLTQVRDVKQEFEDWWKTYPSYDAHGQWERTRRIKTNKVRSRELYAKLLQENISPELLLKALQYDVNLHQKNSIRENKLKYFPNPARWLYQREFENYEESSEDKDISGYVEYGKKID